MESLWNPRMHLADQRRPQPVPRDEPTTPPPAWEAERENLLEMLAQQQRVAQAGLMTAGLAHDVNNHLQVITGVAYLALASDDPREWKAALEKVQAQSRDLAEITSAFVSFVRRRDASRSARFAVRDAVDQVCRLVRPLARTRGVSVVLDADSVGTAAVGGEQRLIVQALVNLASNGIRACPPQDGCLQLVLALPSPDTVSIQVSDNGQGIPEGVRSRLFRPFVTSHEDSGGSGLGLFIVRQCVRKLGGSIRVRTSEAGTTFTIDLPAWRGA